MTAGVPLTRHLARITSVVLALLCLPMAAAAQNWIDDEEYDFWQEKRDPEEASAEDGPEIREPLFAMVIELAENDSLGRWTGRDLLDYAQSTDRQTNLPLEKLVSLSRRRPTAADRTAWPGMKIDAIWDVTLAEDLKPPMPYSILGYHPGTLRVTREIRLAEAHLGRLQIRGEDGPVTVTDVLAFRIESGNLVLDVDGWLDFILGKKLDDAAVLAFVAGRVPGGRVSLAVSVGRDGRAIYGEFDLRQDKVLPHGRPVASGLSRACRGLILQGLHDAAGHGWGRWKD